KGAFVHDSILGCEAAIPLNAGKIIHFFLGFGTRESHPRESDKEGGEDEKGCAGSGDQPGWIYRAAGRNGGFFVYAEGLLDGAILQASRCGGDGAKDVRDGLETGRREAEQLRNEVLRVF